MYLNFVVRIPGVKGKITFRNKNGVDYVYYEYDREYNRTTQRTNPKRATIGKRITNDPENMLPNTNFLKYFPDAKLPEECDRTERSNCLKLGGFLVIRKILDECKLSEVFGDQIDPRIRGLFLDLIAYMIVTENSPGLTYSDYAYCHPLFTLDMEIVSEEEMLKGLSFLEKDHIKMFIKNWNDLFNSQNRVYVSLNQNHAGRYAAVNDYADDEYSPGDWKRPVFDYMAAYDKESNTPLFYGKYPYFVETVSKITTIYAAAQNYGYRFITFVLDNSILYGNELEKLDHIGADYLFMLAGTAPAIKKLILANCGEFETDHKRYIPAYDVFGITVKDNAKLYDTDEKERYYHLYYNSKKARAKRRHLREKLEQMKQFMDDHVGKVCSFGKDFERYFVMKTDDKTGTFQGAKEKTKIIKQDDLVCGYDCIISTEKLSAKEAFSLHHGKNALNRFVPKAIGNNGQWNDRQVENLLTEKMVFLRYLSLILQNRIYQRLTEKWKVSSEWERIPSLSELWSELEKLEMIRLTDNRYHLANAVTDRQTTFFDAFGIDRKYIKYWEKEISNMLLSLPHPEVSDAQKKTT